MFDNMKALEPPTNVANDPNATELLRLWAANKKLDVSINIGIYEAQGLDEAKAWGIIISDFTRHDGASTGSSDTERAKNKKRPLFAIPI